MGAVYRYRCNRCSLEAETSGPWPFYRDGQDRMLMYGDPEPVSEEARRHGIAGYMATVFCLSCRASSVVILESGGQACPRCGGSRLLLEPDPDRPTTCPACGRGVLRARTLWSTHSQSRIQGGFKP